ncbi:disease resistance RPP13-like protein 1 [Artemisia annua]|uniref:Disease resistance RPP13-like protein 1 n=1 Tax=Artemisia annua TaxID=35608 RepID=A0A2U1NE38_ARTAN|nr:disease resistance RPP13-like protein 1 [Artemisia annua]
MDNLTSLSSSSSLGSSKTLSLSLIKLELNGMKSLNAAMNSSTISPVLKTLSIEDFPKITVFDEHHIHPLVKLEISRCTNLESIRSLQGLTSLESLLISECPSLLGIPDLHNLGGSLRELEIRYDHKLTSVPSGFDRLSSWTPNIFFHNMLSLTLLCIVQNKSVHLFYSTLHSM